MYEGTKVRKYIRTKVRKYFRTFEGTSVQRTRTTNVTCTLRCRSAAVQLDCVHLQGYVTGTCTCSARVVMYLRTKVLPYFLKYFRMYGNTSVSSEVFYAIYSRLIWEFKTQAFMLRSPTHHISWYWDFRKYTYCTLYTYVYFRKQLYSRHLMYSSTYVFTYCTVALRVSIGWPI